MNNIFNLKRFILLFKKHSVEHGKTYILSTVVLAGILAIILGFFSYSNDGALAIQVQALLFIYGIAGAGSIFTSLIFSDLGNRRKAHQVLTLPASHFEKYLVAWLYSFIIFQLVFVGVYYMVDWLIISLSSPPPNVHNYLVNVFNWDQRAVLGFMSFGILHGFAMWGSIFFEKQHFIKIAFVFLLFFITITLLSSPLLRLLTGNKDINSVAFGRVFIKDGSVYHVVTGTTSMDHTTQTVLGIFVIIFWISAFYRLKEKEI